MCQIQLTIMTAMHADSLFCISMGPTQRATLAWPRVSGPLTVFRLGWGWCRLMRILLLGLAWRCGDGPAGGGGGYQAVYVEERGELSAFPLLVFMAARGSTTRCSATISIR